MKNLKRMVKTNKQIQLLKSESVWIGLDVHKNSNHVAVWSSKRDLISTWVTPSDGDTLCKQLKALLPNTVRVVYEAGPTGFALARKLSETGFSVQVIAPSKVPRISGKDAKSDRLDCRNLAKLASHRMLQPINIPTEQEEADRQVLRLRDQVIKKRRRIKQQIKSFLLLYSLKEPEGLAYWSKRAVDQLRILNLGDELRFCLNMMLDELAQCETNLRQITAKVRELSLSERYQQRVQLLRSVPGVGLLTAMIFSTELTNPGRFTHQGQVAKILGLAPRVTQSGETRREGRLIKSGNARVRTILIEAAWRWIRLDVAAKAKFQRLLKNTGNPKKAITAIAHKLAIIMWRITITQSQYHPVGR